MARIIQTLDSCNGLVSQISGAEESARLEFADGTLGLDLGTSYVGVVLSWSVINTNLNKPIPVGSGYAVGVINALGALSDEIGPIELSFFRCLGSFVTSITAMIPISRMALELIIGAQDTDKSTIGIGDTNTEAFICIYTISGQEALEMALVGGASFGRMHTEMPDFHGLASHTTSVHGLFTIGITAIDAMSRGVGPKLIIGNRDIAKSAVTIDRIIDQDACN